MKLEITQEIIDTSTRLSAGNCLLARAAKKLGHRGACCDGRSLYVRSDFDSVNNIKLPLTDEALALVTEWDNGKPVSPCTIELPDPQPA